MNCSGITKAFFGVGGLTIPGLLDRACGSISLNELPSPLICSAVLSNGRLFLSSTFFYPTSSTFYFLGNTFSFNLTIRGTSLAITKFWTMFLQKKYAFISKLAAITAM